MEISYLFMHIMRLFIIIRSLELGNGGTCLYFQHSGGRGKWISEFKTSLVYKASTQRNSILKKKGRKGGKEGGRKEILIIIKVLALGKLIY